MQPGRQDIHVVRFVDVISTNLLALEYGTQGAAHGTIIAAVQQSGGRGRLNRSFFSPPGGLYFSLILRPVMFSDYQPLLTLAAGVACSMITEMPTAEMTACTKRPEQMPRLLTAPSRQPPRTVLRMTSIESTPGVMVSRVMATR